MKLIELISKSNFFFVWTFRTQAQVKFVVDEEYLMIKINTYQQFIK